VIATLSSVSTPTAGMAGSNVSATAIPEASCGGKGDRGPMILDVCASFANLCHSLVLIMLTS
jgi:hypothetical protein